MEGIQRMVETFAKGPMGPVEMRQVMTLQVFDPSLLDDTIIDERAAIAPSQPANLFSTMWWPNMTDRLTRSRPDLGLLGHRRQFNPDTGALKVMENAPNARCSCSTAAGTGCRSSTATSSTAAASTF